ncbi:MAG: DUF2723 domain-containing protein [Gemmatimonadota bacterium]|nr:DUF2723 domain-containing protein [Gemmatimonadota bacterium]
MSERPPGPRARRARWQLPPWVFAPVLTMAVLFPAYLATAAPDLTFWDASELVTAVRTLGIPHPPGTPLWVLVGRVVSGLFSATGPARAVTMLSVLSGTAAGAVGASLLRPWIGTRGAVVAAVMAGTMTTVWSNATETEVYALALLASALLLLIGDVAGRPTTRPAQRDRARALLVFVAALAVPLHLSVLVALPAAVLLAWHGPRVRGRDLLVWGALALLALSAVAVLPLLSAQAPALNSGRPDSLSALLAVLRREQYEVAGLWPRRAPLWLQLGNVFQWADWQVAFGVHPFPTPSGPRAALTVAWAWLALLGGRALWRHDARVGHAMVVLLLSGTMGVACWLNLRAGPTFGGPFIPVGALHEARERDYFFALGFWAWGLMAGAGLTAMATTLARRLPAPVAMLPLLIGVLPLVANRTVMDRTREPAASLPRTYARLLLDAVPQYGVLFTAGDNDTFPLWYLQQVEDYRSDVTIVTVPLLGAEWYRRTLADRRLLPDVAVRRWPGLETALRSVVLQAAARGRPVRVSTLLAREDRERMDRAQGWALEGLVYAPAPGTAAGTRRLDRAALARQRDQVPPSALRPVPAGADPVVRQIQELLRCTQVVRIDDPLLVSSCHAP